VDSTSETHSDDILQPCDCLKLPKCYSRGKGGCCYPAWPEDPFDGPGLLAARCAAAIQASDLDAQTAHILHYQLDAGIHYLVIDNTKEFGQTKPSGDVTVFLAINVISAGQMGSRFGEIVVPTWVAAAGLAAVLCALGAASICGCLLLLRHPAPPRDEHEESDPELMLVRRSRSTGRGSPLKSKVGLKRSSLVGKKLAGLYSQPEKERTA